MAPAEDEKAPKAAAKPGPNESAAAGKAAKAQQAKGKAKAKPKPPSAETLAKQLTEAKEAKVDAEREQRYAEADLEIAEMGAAGTEIEVVESLRSARAELAAAQDALAVFDATERPLKVAKAQLAVADAEERLLTAETDLVGLEDIFAQEVEASAKPEILRRGRRKVERAKRALEVAVTESTLTIDHELPNRLKELSGKVRAKESALLSAQNNAAKDRRSAELKVEKATDEADAKKRASGKATAKVKSLQKRVNDARQKAQGGKKKAAPKKK